MKRLLFTVTVMLFSVFLGFALGSRSRIPDIQALHNELIDKRTRIMELEGDLEIAIGEIRYQETARKADAALRRYGL